MFRSQDQSTKDDEKGKREASAHNRRQNPGDDDGRDALHVREVGRLLTPNDAIRSACHESHANHTADARVRGGDGHFKGGRNDEPNGDGEDDAKATVHEENGVFFEAILVSDASLHCLHNVTSHKHGATEFEDCSEEDSVLDGERARANGRGERVRDIVSACVDNKR